MIDLGTFLTQLLPLALLGAICGLDLVSFPQIMISRPIVSATLAGALLGNAEAGLFMGALLELIALGTLPFGASRYPEWGSAGVVGGAVYVLLPSELPGTIPLGMAAALLTGLIGTSSMVMLRKFNAHGVQVFRPATDRGASIAVTMIQLRGVTADFVRGGLLTLVMLLITLPTSNMLVRMWLLDAARSRAVVVAIAASVAASAVWTVFHTIGNARWLFVAGLLAGGAIVWGLYS